MVAARSEKRGRVQARQAKSARTVTGTYALRRGDIPVDTFRVRTVCVHEALRVYAQRKADYVDLHGRPAAPPAPGDVALLYIDARSSQLGFMTYFTPRTECAERMRVECGGRCDEAA